MIYINKRPLYTIVSFICISVAVFLFVVPEPFTKIKTLTNDGSDQVGVLVHEDTDLIKSEGLTNEKRMDYNVLIHNLFIVVEEYFPITDRLIVAIGDSLTQGVGDETNQGGYIGILQQIFNETNANIQFENFGISGHRTDQLLNRFKDDKVIQAIENADIILMTIGANDIMQVVKENFTNLTYDLFTAEQSNYKIRLQDIFEHLRSLNDKAHIYLLGIYNPFQLYFPEIKELEFIVNDWNQMNESLTIADGHSTFIPIKDIFEDDNGLFSDDYFHPNSDGYNQIAERVQQYLAHEGVIAQ